MTHNVAMATYTIEGPLSGERLSGLDWAEQSPVEKGGSGACSLRMLITLPPVLSAVQTSNRISSL